jgi:hypothetical protein
MIAVCAACFHYFFALLELPQCAAAPDDLTVFCDA